MPDDEWVDCFKYWPYRDFKGTWRWPVRTQKRTVVRDGKELVEYRERDIGDEYDGYW